MSSAWLDPGSHAVCFYKSDATAYESIADFFTAGADPDDLLVLVARRSTFDAVAGRLASGRYGPPKVNDRIHFADAEAVLFAIVDSDTVDPVRCNTFFTQLLAGARGSQIGGKMRLFCEAVDVMCERGNFAAAVVLEGLAGRVFELEPGLSMLCGYIRARFDGAGAVHKPAVCSLHTHVVEGDPPAPFVYVIDDDTGIRRSLGRLLKLSQWQVRTFDSAEAFLADVDNLSPGCLVIDIQLGGMSGLDLLAHMKATRPTWPAIAMSGSDDDGAKSEALRLGARAFLRKPFDARPFLDAVALALA